jgi:hypothetical protein
MDITRIKIYYKNILKFTKTKKLKNRTFRGELSIKQQKKEDERKK